MATPRESVVASDFDFERQVDAQNRPRSTERSVTERGDRQRPRAALFTWLGPPAEAGLDQKSADIDIYKWMQLQFQIWMRFEMSHTLICGDSDVNQTLKYATVSYLPVCIVYPGFRLE